MTVDNGQLAIRSVVVKTVAIALERTRGVLTRAAVLAELGIGALVNIHGTVSSFVARVVAIAFVVGQQVNADASVFTGRQNRALVDFHGTRYAFVARAGAIAFIAARQVVADTVDARCVFHALVAVGFAKLSFVTAADAITGKVVQFIQTESMNALIRVAIVVKHMTVLSNVVHFSAVATVRAVDSTVNFGASKHGNRRRSPETTVQVRPGVHTIHAGAILDEDVTVDRNVVIDHKGVCTPISNDQPQNVTTAVARADVAVNCQIRLKFKQKVAARGSITVEGDFTRDHICREQGILIVPGIKGLRGQWRRGKILECCASFCAQAGPGAEILHKPRGTTEPIASGMEANGIIDTVCITVNSEAGVDMDDVCRLPVDLAVPVRRQDIRVEFDCIACNELEHRVRVVQAIECERRGHVDRACSSVDSGKQCSR